MPEEHQTNSKNAKNLASVPHAALRVLLVDDYWINQKVAVRMLEKLGIKPKVAVDGQEAFEAIRDETFDLVFMDCEMPIMDGYTATKMIRELAEPRFQTLPIIAMTAHADTENRERCLDSGMSDYISKPIRIQDLQEALDRHHPR